MIEATHPITRTKVQTKTINGDRTEQQPGCDKAREMIAEDELQAATVPTAGMALLSMR